MPTFQSWERAPGVANDACRDDRVEPASSRDTRKVHRGTPYEEVLTTLGQPHTRDSGTRLRTR